MEICFFFFQAEDGIRDIGVTGVQTCALPIYAPYRRRALPPRSPPTPRRRAARNLPRDRPAADRSHSADRAPEGSRSEERRVGKECRSRWWAYHENKKGSIERR